MRPSPGLPGVSLKPPAQKAPHGGELGFQQAEEEVRVLRRALLGLEAPSEWHRRVCAQICCQ